MEAVLLIGLQGAGKTTFYRDRLAATHVHVSLDEAKTRERERQIITEAISRNASFAVDNTNVLKSERALYIGLAKAAGYRVVAYYFKPNVRTAIGRNKHRTDKKPIAVPAILATFKRLQAPEVSEGFDELHEL